VSGNNRPFRITSLTTSLGERGYIVFWTKESVTPSSLIIQQLPDAVDYDTRR